MGYTYPLCENSKNDETIINPLTNIEFRILYALVIHQGNILSKEQIYNFVWNGEYLRDDSNITSHVRRLRKNLRTIQVSLHISKQ